MSNLYTLGVVSTNQVPPNKSVFAQSTTVEEYTTDLVMVINNARAASTVNLAVVQVGNRLTGAAPGALTLDTITPFINGQVVLIKDQALTEQNGVYIVVNPGSGGSAFVLTRDPDFEPAVRSTIVYVLGGATQADTAWFCVKTNLYVTNVDPVIFLDITGGGGGGGVTDAANVGGFAEVFQSKVGTILNFRTLQAGPNITITQNANDISIEASSGAGDITNGANVGGFAEVFQIKAGATLNFRTLQAGTNMSITQNANDLLLDATGDITNAANVGGFVQVFQSKVGTTLNFRTLQAGTNITLTQNANDVLIDATGDITNAANVGGFAQVFQSKTGTTLNFRTLQAGTNISITQNANDLLIAAPSVSGNITYTLATMQINVIDESSFIPMAYFPWRNAEFSTYTSGHIIFRAVIVDREAIVRFYDATGAASLGTTTTTGSGVYSFNVSNPGVDSGLQFEVQKSAAAGTDPQIFGVILIYTK